MIDLNLKNNVQLDNALAELQSIKSKNKYSEKDLEKLKKAAQNFEAILVNQILKSMRKSIPESGLFGEGVASEFYTGMFDEHIAKAVADKGGFHLSDTIIESFTNDGRNGLPVQILNDYRLRPISTRVQPTKTQDWDRGIIAQAANEYNLDPKLVKAVIKVESNFKANAVSNKGAVGLMQLMKATADDLGVKNRYDARQNIFGGAKYLRMMLDRFDGNLELAVGAYNAGPSAVEKYNGIPPYKETRRYVEKVLSNYRDM